nr:glycosyltransferase [Lachnospiraceae bacterium]
TSPMLSYKTEYVKFMPTAEELESQREEYEKLSFKPLVSIVVPTYETPEAFLRELIDSVLAQTYGNFELVLADASASDAVKTVCETYDDFRIKRYKLEKNGGISINTNQGFEKAMGEYVALIDHDDIITPNALFEMVKKISEYDEADRKFAIVYSDEDKISGAPYEYSRPHFKPDFNEEFVRRNNYFCHFLMFSKNLVDLTGGLNNDFDGAQDYDFVLRCLKEGAKPTHVPKILYHWRIHEGSTAGHSENKSYAFDAGCRAIENYLSAIGEHGKASTTTNLGVYHVEYDELSNVKYVVSTADSSNDLSTEDEKSLAKILAHDGVIAVAPRLVDERGKVVSVGLAYDKDGNVADLCGGIPSVYKGYFLHGVIPKDVSAVRFDGVIWKEEFHAKYLEIRKELEDKGLKGKYLDMASCLRMRAFGRIVIDPEVTYSVKSNAYHEDLREDASQKKLFLELCKGCIASYDPAYSPSLRVEAGKTYSMR